MKKFLVLCCVAAVLALTGCDPFGTDETKAYVTGMAYADTAWTEPLEGVTILMTGDSVNTYSQSTLTAQDGVFFMEIQLYPAPGGEGDFGYVLPGYAVLGLEAFYQGGHYIYADIKSNPFVIQVGDTLTVEPVDIYMLTGAK